VGWHLRTLKEKNVYLFMCFLGELGCWEDTRTQWGHHQTTLRKH
jgi:hypothetical protein